MRRRRRREEADNLNLSFLDAISCGFGAVILLLVITMLFEPDSIQTTREEAQALITSLEQQLAEIQARTAVLARQLSGPRGDEQQTIAELQAELTRIRGQYRPTRASVPETAEEGELKAARQRLTEEMRRMLADYRPPAGDTTVGGIPVDSEYIVFVIDTSGSMYQGPWQLVLRKISETLSVYPKLRGIQVMNDEGKYMFPSYAGKWMPDTPGVRKNIISRLATWNPYSDSSPVEGIVEAVNSFYEPGRKISIYIYGDDFPQGQVEAVARYVDRVNTAGKDGERLVRIHAVGFPTQFAGGQDRNGTRFANLMRALCERNGGSFVALTTL
ncbi:MAG: VWA domain-containing protein [Gammaproteobacteria bacterium]|jgi:hypothetical protein|nr:VWA domain-containing protein [Gammaproteobacteria bacterium]